MIFGEVGAEGIGRPTPAKWLGWSSPHALLMLFGASRRTRTRMVPALAHPLSSCLRNYVPFRRSPLCLSDSGFRFDLTPFGSGNSRAHTQTCLAKRMRPSRKPARTNSFS